MATSTTISTSSSRLQTISEKGANPPDLKFGWPLQLAPPANGGSTLRYRCKLSIGPETRAASR